MKGKDCRAFKNLFRAKDAIKLRGGIEAVAGEVELEEIQVQTNYWTNVSLDYAIIDKVTVVDHRSLFPTRKTCDV